ncbi:M20/M25/M40 family metallo-hydrolase [Sphingomonas crocodyli]|uniref:M20/M25/M40 family metallo-hydrolase n=1 Tax=Sphingomonas crocodyli TaxID=1979270 RepID=A0A437LVD7_9SPHN|nr:M20/M25/M40 family metallo-hydrolase [Sphingomonas crocodyli]RVT89385.1 M20/M25/M40 family metallo-hydrolase [Sphingomonas crocodyli]
MPSNTARWVALIAALAGALVWIVLASIPPTPRGADAPPTVFSAVRAMEVVRAVGHEPHVLGSDADARVRAWLIARLRTLGAEVSEQPVPLDPKAAKRLAKWIGRPADGITGTNIIARLPGRDPALPAVAIMAHHDSVEGSPGAADDGIGVATAVEALRAIRAVGKPPERDVLIILTDGEEIGLNGAKAFFDNHPLRRRVGAMVNLDARGAGGRANMFETGRGNGAMMALYADKIARPAANSVSVLVYDRMPNSTDYTPAKARGIPGFNIAPLDRAWTYHSPLSTPDALDPGTLQDMGDQTLGVIRAMAFARDLPAREPDAAFADLMGRWMIVYSAGWGWVVLGLAAALFLLPRRSSGGWSLSLFSRAVPSASTEIGPSLRWGDVAGGVIVTLTFLVHTALLITALNALSGSGHSNYYDRLAAIPRLEVQAWCAIAAMIALLPLMRRLDIKLLAIVPAQAMMWIGLLSGGPLILLVLLAVVAMGLAAILPRDADGPTGSAALLFFIAMITQILAPTAAPFFAWPLLLVAIGAVARGLLPSFTGLAVTALVAAIGLGHIGSMAHFVMLALGAELPPVLVVALLAGLPLLWPLLPERGDWRAAAPLLAIAIGIALWVRFDAMAPSIATYSLSEGAKTK